MDRTQIERIVVATLGLLATFVGRVPWFGSILVAMVTDPNVSAFITDKIVAILQRLGDTAVPTTAAAFAQAYSEGGFQAAPGDAAIDQYMQQMEQKAQSVKA